MVRKGKFKLLSYFIDEYLIFYKSLNRTKKYIAFSILKSEEYNSLIPVLNKFLIQRFLTYYSIQININSRNKKVILLNIEDKKKDRILKFFNLIYQELKQSQIKIQFLSNNQLETTFLNDLFTGFNFKASKIKDSLLIKGHEFTAYYDIYDLNLNEIDNRNTFFHSFLSLLENFNRKGTIIINFKRDISDNVIFIINFMDVKKEFNTNEKFEIHLNNFFNSDLLKKRKMGINKIFCLLWRLGISNYSYTLNEFHELFSNEIYNDFKDLPTFNTQFEYNLKDKHIKFKRLNQNFMFIEQNSLFYTAPDLNYKIILKILKKYYSKFFIFFLFLKDEEYEKLVKIEKIALLKKVKILSKSEFLNLNFNDFKKNLLLEYSQINSDILSRVVRM